MGGGGKGRKSPFFIVCSSHFLLSPLLNYNCNAAYLWVEGGTARRISFCFELHNKLHCAHILIGSHFWSIRGQMHKLCQITSNRYFCVWQSGERTCSSYFERFWNKQAFLHILFLYYIKQIDSMLPFVCSVIDHRRRWSVMRTSVTHLAIASCATFLFLPHFDVICDDQWFPVNWDWSSLIEIAGDYNYFIEDGGHILLSIVAAKKSNYFTTLYMYCMLY